MKVCGGGEVSPATGKAVGSPDEREKNASSSLKNCPYSVKVAQLSPPARRGVLCVFPEGVQLREKVGGRVPKVREKAAGTARFA